MQSQLKNQKKKNFLQYLNLNCSPLQPKASVPPMSYTDTFSFNMFHFPLTSVFPAVAVVHKKSEFGFHVQSKKKNLKFKIFDI